MDLVLQTNLKAMTSKVTGTKVVMYLADSEDSALKSMASLCDSKVEMR